MCFRPWQFFLLYEGGEKELYGHGLLNKKWASLHSKLKYIFISKTSEGKDPDTGPINLDKVVPSSPFSHIMIILSICNMTCWASILLLPTWHQQRITFYQNQQCRSNCFMWHSRSDSDLRDDQIDIICFLTFPMTFHKSLKQNHPIEMQNRCNLCIKVEYKT